MNTQSRKQEALALLALPELSTSQRARLNVLTGEQAGYQFSAMTEAEYREDSTWISPFPKTYWLVSNGAAVRYVGPEFTRSADACLALPKPAELFWDLQEAIEDSPFTAWLMDIEELEEPVARDADKHSLACAMLKCWWAIQED